MSNAAALPAGFEELQPFTAYWARGTSDERLAARCEASMDDIRAFYDAMLPRADSAMSLIDEDDVHNLPAEKATLAKLVLALAQAAVAVEIHGEPRSPGTPYPNSIRISAGAAPFG